MGRLTSEARDLRHMLHLEYFRSFVNLEDFIPEGCSLKKQQVTYL